MPMETGEVMASCEIRLLKNKTIEKPFTAAQIAEGAIQDHLTQDYDAPLKVNIFTVSYWQLTRDCDLIVPLSDHN